mmetsp:Transcript_31964/g.75941  ORF Transcript_31964/g.75941 Transcript_31964/m.75941 type:complete len:367 (+) Transcript_31964:471-1571(+)
MPLYLNRVPTVLSLSQLDKDGPDGPINAASLLTPDAAVLDVHGAYLPVYNYATAKVLKSKRVRSFGDLLSVPDIDAFVGPTLQFSDVSGSSDDDSNSSLANDVPAEAFSPRSGLRRSALDNILITEWDARSEQGLFRYDVTACESKLLPGKWGFVSQCNEGRGSKKRATEYRIDKVVQEFDRSKFNFTKALQKEVLFAFDMGDAPDDLEGHNFELKPVEESPSLVFINVSPIEHGHVLLVPRVLDFLPQQATPETVLTCLAFVKAANNPYFRAGFNSLGAYGTINHLHFQVAVPSSVRDCPLHTRPPPSPPTQKKTLLFLLCLRELSCSLAPFSVLLLSQPISLGVGHAAISAGSVPSFVLPSPVV